jgi:hypothetical protein
VALVAQLAMHGTLAAVKCLDDMESMEELANIGKNLPEMWGYDMSVSICNFWKILGKI